MPAPILVCFLLLIPQSSECADATSCRQAALDAADRGEFEAFHDLAWRAVQKGRPSDPALMALVARAQSLSGRPGDALVMLRRLAQMGVVTDAATSDDFRRVRALPGWPEVEAMLEKGAMPSTPPPASVPAAPVAPEAKAKAREPEPTIPEKPAAPSAAPEADALPAELASIQPAGLAYDAVSRRFIVGERRENKLVIFDEVFKRATDMVRADSAGFFGLTALEIDPRRGDLWVANSAAGRASVHKLQLVSGRVLFELAVPAAIGPASFVDVAVLANGHVLLLDALGRRVLAVSPTRRAFERAAAVNVEGATSLAPSDGQVAYVSHRRGILRVDLARRAGSPVRGAPAGLLRIRADGRTLIGVQSTDAGHHIVRLRLDTAGKRVTAVDVLDGSAAMPDASAITIADGVVYYITFANGVPVIRRVKARRYEAGILDDSGSGIIRD